MLKPLGDRVVLRLAQETEQAVGGILIASNAQEKSIVGTVVAVSEQTMGELAAPQGIAVGDEVLFDQYAGTKITVDGDELLVLHAKDIIGVM